MVVLAPSRSPELVRESRRLIRAGDFFDPDGGVRVLGVGELLPLAPSRRGTPPAPPLDVTRTLDDVLSRAPLDFVHVHEPFAPSTASLALRHSRALNVGTFHAPAERVDLDAGRAPLRRALLRPARRPHRVVRGDARADGARVPRQLPGAARGRRDPGADGSGRRAADRVRRPRGAPGAAAVPARAAPAARRRPVARDGLHARRRPHQRAAQQPARPRRRRHRRGDDRGARARRRGRRRRRLGRPGPRARAARARDRRRRGAARRPVAGLRGGARATASAGCCSSPATPRR